MDINKNIQKTKEGFEKSFSEKIFYERQTKDDSHLELILNIINIKDGERILDLGTGTGFLAIPIAQRNKNSQVIGLDIVEETLRRNRKLVQEKHIDNLKFISYDGLKFPIEDNSIDLLVTRYALHHFPCIKDTFNEISRVLKKGGRAFICDPTPNDNDSERFVDKFMQLKDDGHIKFYRLQEFIDIAEKAGLKFILNEETKIRFPRKHTEECKKLLSESPRYFKEEYEVDVVNNEVLISENVLNIIFKKR